jgi:tetratricopeptide (TPR) repeat protein
MRRLFMSAAALVVLTGCATEAHKPATQAADAPPAVSAYGMYLAGQGALNDGRSAQAADYFQAARGAGGADDAVDEKAFTAAVLAGDIPRAAAIAPTDADASEAIRRMGAVVRGVEFLAEGKGKDAYAVLNSSEIGFPHKAAAALLSPWAAAQAGDVDASLVRPQVRGDKVVDYFGTIGQGLLFERAGRFDEAETDLKAAASGDSPSELATLTYGAFLERRGRRLDAVALYEAALGEGPNDALSAAKARAAAGRPAPPAPTIRQGAAQALLAPTATMVAAKQGQLALAYLRLLLRLDPERSDAWVMVGDLMQAGGDVTAAREAYGHVKPGSADYVAAQGKLAWSYEQAGDHERALAIARAAAASGDSDARLTLADLLRDNEKYQEAVDILTDLMKAEAKPDWRLLFGRAVCYEKLGRWSDSEVDLQAALALRPDEPELLNYLGYSWIDRGVHLQEALVMVQKAVAATPDSGAMADSLGWAYYKLGDFNQAVSQLEAAVELEAGDPEINDHLGDAYWRAGRHDEAQFQWHRVLTLNPDAKLRTQVEAKIASPSGPDGPQKVAGK